MKWVLSALLVGVVCAQDADTQRLARDLRAARGQERLFPAQVKTIREQLLAWTDARLKRGLSIDQLNTELDAAKLIAPASMDNREDIYQPYAGYLAEMYIGEIEGANDWMLVSFAIGMTCAFDQTAVIYQRNPLKRIGWIQYHDSEGSLAWGLESLSAGPPNGKGERILAAALMHRWCTSGWGSIEARIWKVKEGMRPVLIRGIGVNRTYPVSVEISGDTVAFRYSDMTFDFEQSFVQPRIHRLRIDGYHAERIPPYAVTILGYIDHWLATDGAATKKWMAGQKGLFRVTTVTRCPGEVRLWQVEAKPWESEETRVFLVEENGAEDLRMIGVLTRPMRPCPSIDKKGAARELPATP